MNILFIGNCASWVMPRYLPYILNKFNHNIHIKICYSAGASGETYINHFDTKLTNRVTKAPSKSPNVIYTYVRGNDKYEMSRMPDISVHELISSENWDKIILYVGRAKKPTQFELFTNERILRELIHKISEISDAKIYIGQGSMAQTDNRPDAYGFDLCIKMGNKYSKIDKDNERIIIDSIFRRYCQILGVDTIPFLSIYSRLQKSKIGNKYMLLQDGYHPDPYIGSYTGTSILYYKLFYKEFGVKLSDLELNIDCPPKKYTDRFNGCEVDCQCVPVTKETKGVVDEIVERYFKIK